MKLLPYLALWALLAFMGAAGTAAWSGFPRQLSAHLAFAVGALPLIFAAMMHFVPVLTRSAGAPRWLARLPVLALLGGLGVAASFAWPAWWLRGPSLAALPALVAALILLIWQAGKGRSCLGKPHPGLWWYGAALACLILALLAVPIMEWMPAWRQGLRLFHLHLNTLGFIGLTAVGTLQVLLPTAAGRPDPSAALRLQRDLPLAVLGVLLAAGGVAMGWTPLAWLGLLPWLLPPLALAIAWLKLYRPEITRKDGAAASLAWALLGLMLIALAHGLGLARGENAVGAFFLAFLLPLVTGALSQLLPIWLKPGRQNDWHVQARARLGRHAGLRGGAFVLAGLAWLFGWPAPALLAPPALIQFLAALATVRKPGVECRNPSVET